MRKDFFAGDTYTDEKFKGLIPEFYPKKYKEYISQEEKLLKEKIDGSKSILEAGVGIGRLIPVLSPFVKRFIGIDNSEFMIKKSKENIKEYKNVEIIKEDIENINKKFPENYFDYSLCVWNTLGNVKDPILVLKSLKEVTQKSIFITVFYKGTIQDRLDFYSAVDVTIKNIDKKTETFELEGYFSKTFNEKDITEIARKAELIVKETKILGDVILWAELSKN